jgi:hypothetical protein
VKRAGYEQAKKLIAAGWCLVGQQQECRNGGTSTFARLISPTATDGCYFDEDLYSVSWGCFKKLGGQS